MQQIKINLWHNDEAMDWSIEVNGLRNEHVTSEIIESLVECALIVAEKSLTSAVPDCCSR
jgi:hypothetical protein